jgi:hypothetical protein
MGGGGGLDLAEGQDVEIKLEIVRAVIIKWKKMIFISELCTVLMKASIQKDIVVWRRRKFNIDEKRCSKIS